MDAEREQLNERYMDAQLRESLGPEADLSENVLRALYAKPRRMLALPPKRSIWGPLVAAAAVLFAAGVATYALVTFLPDELTPRSRQAQQRKDTPRENPHPRPAPNQERPSPKLVPAPEQPIPEPNPGPLPEGEVPEPVPKAEKIELPDPEIEYPDDHWPPGYTDPPDAWPDRPGRPDPAKPVVPDPTNPTKRAVLATGWKGEGLTVTRDGRQWKWKESDWGELLDGDRVSTKGAVDFTLASGGLLRLDGDLSFGLDGEAAKLLLHDGALYADTSAEIVVTTPDVEAAITGVAVLEERPHRMDVFCIEGKVHAASSKLGAGFHARLEKDGFGREKAITWDDVQREFRFLKEAPARVTLCEELDEAPGELFGGEIANGVLAGEADGRIGIGFYLREPYETRTGDVVRFRFRAGKACEMILQFGTVGDSNWRHKMGGIKAGEWIEYELPLVELYKTTDVAQKAEPGLKLKFFQLHPEEGAALIEIDRVEIVHRP